MMKVLNLGSRSEMTSLLALQAAQWSAGETLLSPSEEPYLLILVMEYTKVILLLYVNENIFRI